MRGSGIRKSVRSRHHLAPEMYKDSSHMKDLGSWILEVL